MADMTRAAEPLKLDRLDHFPDKLLGAEPCDILGVFPNPTLITLAGEAGPPLWVTTLLHGNETTSFYVLRALAAKYRDRPPPRNLSVFVGNVEATAAGVRYLPGQQDFNRIWADGHSPYHRLVHDVAEIARAECPFASIDIHNNSGTNPHYGCVNALRPADLNLAAMFAPLGVYYRNPATTQSIAFSSFCPAVTVECGRSGDEAGIARAIDFVERTMRLDRFPDAPPSADTVRLYHTLGSVLIDPECDFAFGGDTMPLNLRSDLERLNFTDLPADTPWANVHHPVSPLRVVDEHGNDLTAQFFRRDGDTIRLRCPATPAMVTQDRTVIRQDCLCYLMEPL
ncbi:M14 family metallopeptidase [Parasphingopyxis sp.]|uniref:M14 family metallopeptidase n=1 Tax=Parasphingopyxis sp. TaxID=1920299 RepID=UPI002601869A|nr:M14 family metallopeptidase [Parasphingopyxis sp.]